jgi:hypothetical protein
VHESYLRFAAVARLELRDRAHFMRWAGRDAIVLKALRKRPGERYATVDALADDLENDLAGIPCEHGLLVRGTGAPGWSRATSSPPARRSWRS